MGRGWKLPYMLKGMLICARALNAWRLHRATTGGSASARCYYSVWLRHLVPRDQCGLKVRGAQIV